MGDVMIMTNRNTGTNLHALASWSRPVKYADGNISPKTNTTVKLNRTVTSGFSNKLSKKTGNASLVPQLTNSNETNTKFLFCTNGNNVTACCRSTSDFAVRALTLMSSGSKLMTPIKRPAMVAPIMMHRNIMPQLYT